MTNRFDLEQDIMQCWAITEDLELLLNKYENMSEDARLNYLIGLKQMYQLKFENLWEDFETCIRNKEI